MVNILPPAKNIGSQIGASLGLGLAKGSASALDKYQKSEELKSILSSIYPKNQMPLADQGGTDSPQIPQAPIPQNQTPKLSPAQILAISSRNPQLAKLLQDQQYHSAKIGFQEKKLALDETKDYRNTVQKQAQSASELEPVLNQMENLINTGKLSNPIIAKFADKFGLIGLLDPTSQQYQGLSVGFFKDLKNLFGAAVSDLDLTTYINKIPQLTQTDKGKRVLIDNFRVLGEASQVRNRIKNQIVRENGGIPPLDLQEQVEKKSAPILNKLGEKFNKNIYNQIGQSLPSMPEASKYSGRMIIDEETGQRFKSNGKEWIAE